MAIPGGGVRVAGKGRCYRPVTWPAGLGPLPLSSRPMGTTLATSLGGTETGTILARLAEFNTAYSRVYPGEPIGRQPVHTIYGGGHLFRRDSARRLGNDLAFQQLAEFNIGQMKAAKVTKLLSICPHCVRTIGTDWRELGVEFEIEHHSEFLARHDGKLPAVAGGPKVVYHDPCYLGRYQDRYEEPRDVVRGAGTLVEAGRNRERSFCCGAGGGLVFLGEEKGKRVSHERAEELAATGAEVVGAACPFCNTMFRDALSAVRPVDAPKLLDIAQLAAARLPKVD